MYLQPLIQGIQTRHGVNSCSEYENVFHFGL